MIFGPSFVSSLFMTLLYLWIIPSLFFNSLDSGVIESYVQYFWREKMLAADGFPSLALIEIDDYFLFSL